MMLDMVSICHWLLYSGLFYQELPSKAVLLESYNKKEDISDEFA